MIFTGNTLFVSSNLFGLGVVTKNILGYDIYYKQNYTFTATLQPKNTTFLPAEHTGDCFSISKHDRDCFSLSVSETDCFFINIHENDENDDNKPPLTIDLSHLGITNIYAVHIESSSMYLVCRYVDPSNGEIHEKGAWPQRSLRAAEAVFHHEGHEEHEEQRRDRHRGLDL